ncbi:MAG: TetR/AcrR family transcriptional regulator [Candidatus Binataceae bacterium]|nr:TetR/AcrR family transcriptional regulator [Candidatus Binataceae bacterium]
MAAVDPQEQAQGSRDEIMRAAMRLFADRGFHETSMSEVAREARVSKALIFWHFKTKEDLFMAVLNRLLEPYFIDFGEETELDERAQILKLVEMYLLFVRDHANSVRFFLAQLLHDEHRGENLGSQVLQLYTGYRNLLTSLLAQAQQKGSCAHGYTAESAAAFLLSALNGFLIDFLFMRDSALNPENALTMVREWLFGESGQGSRADGQAVA